MLLILRDLGKCGAFEGRSAIEILIVGGLLVLMICSIFAVLVDTEESDPYPELTAVAPEGLYAYGVQLKGPRRRINALYLTLYKYCKANNLGIRTTEVINVTDYYVYLDVEFQTHNDEQFVHIKEIVRLYQ